MATDDSPRMRSMATDGSPRVINVNPAAPPPLRISAPSANFSEGLNSSSHIVVEPRSEDSLANGESAKRAASRMIGVPPTPSNRRIIGSPPTPNSVNNRRSEFMDNGRDSTTAVTVSRLASFRSAIGRLSLLLFVIVVVFTTSLVYKQSKAGAIVTAAMYGLASVVPITALVLRADPSARTPWLWCEITTILGVVVSSVVGGLTVLPPPGYDIRRWPQTLLTISTAAALTIPLVIAHRMATGPKDLRRVRLCIATAVWAPLFLLPGKLGLYPPFVFFVVNYVAFLCALFLGASLFLDRKNHSIEHSIPYAACYGWGIATSMVGFQIILGISTPSLLLLNVILSVYSAFVQWCFSQLSSRITTVRDERSFMLPGFFAVEMFQVVLYAIVTDVTLVSWDFAATLAFQEWSSVMRNVGATRILWHRFLRVVGRETASEHPFGSRRAMKVILHWAVADSIAELMGILTVYAVAVIETLMSYIGDGDVLCTVARCRPKTADVQLLYLYGVVLVVRIVVVVGERALLLRVMAYYQRTGAARVPLPQPPQGPRSSPFPAMKEESNLRVPQLTPAVERASVQTVANHDSPEWRSESNLPVSPVTPAEEGESVEAIANRDSPENMRRSRTSSRSLAPRISFSANSTRRLTLLGGEMTIGLNRFKYEVRKLLGGDNSGTTYALVVAVFVVVMTYASVIRNGF